MNDQAGQALPPNEPFMAALAAWQRPPIPGSDSSMSGAGAPPPGQSAADLVELRMVVDAALEHNRDVSEMLTDALSARPGSLAQITAAVTTLRHTADRLEALTRRETGERAPGQRT